MRRRIGLALAACSGSCTSRIVAWGRGGNELNIAIAGETCIYTAEVVVLKHVVRCGYVNISGVVSKVVALYCVRR